ncbi:unnamed protein product [Phytophthora fragariaefolia]|uniref:Unnamed protein product n=1 Tax=Phytophthora fragariaefolia TaxID=1490495 RepID=A0A9W6UBW5_9STRA|nr:unnamed protein product [Phytophthora fragariaefolia]
MPLPTRQELAATLLDEAYSVEWENVKVVLEGQKIVAVVCDGWSNPNSQKFMAVELSNVIDEVEAVIRKGSVCAVVTDNASNLVKAWEILISKIPFLTCNG